MAATVLASPGCGGDSQAQPAKATSAWEAEADQRHAAEASRTSAAASVSSAAASASRAAAASSASASASAAAAAAASSSAAAAAAASSSAAAAEEAARTVVYSVTSNGSGTALITYATFTGGGMQQAQDASATLPWTKTLTLSSGGMNIMSLVAQASSGANDQSISCSISRGGRVIATNTSTGGYAVVTCSA
jgi:copper(I)-binding protein